MATSTAIGPNTLQEQLSKARQHVNGRDPKALAEAVSKLFLAYQAGGGEGLKGMVGSYCAILSDLPVWAAIAACNEWPRGKYRDEDGARFNGKYPPTAEQLHTAGEAEAGFAKRELERIEQAAGLGVLGTVRYRAARPGEKTVGEVAAEREAAEAEAATPEQRERIAAGLAALQGELVDRVVDGPRPPTPEEIERARRYDEIAAINRGKRAMGERNLPIPPEHRLELAELPGGDKRTEEQKDADAKASLERRAAELGVDLSRIPDQPSSFRRPAP